MKDLFKKRPVTRIVEESITSHLENTAAPEVPEGMWKKCNHCRKPLFTEDVIDNNFICPKCGGYFRLHARRRIAQVTDEFTEWDETMDFVNPIGKKDYEAKHKAAQEKSGLNEAIVTGLAKLDGMEYVLGVMDNRFMMASMGRIVGEKIVRAVEVATEKKLPVVLFCCSGGARMQEGMVSLMQMAKTSAALKKHSDAGLLYISVLTEPTTGGVTASFAMLGDIILAEPDALIGFAGPRVIEQTIGQKLPKGFQKAEFQLEHGYVDAIVERNDYKKVLGKLLIMHRNSHKGIAYTDITQNMYTTHTEKNDDIVYAENETEKISGMAEQFRERYAGESRFSPWERVQISRSNERPTGLDYVNLVFDDFFELHGDRGVRDDGAIVGGIAFYQGMPVTVIVQQKGKNTAENIKRNFAMPSPEGYRKALRLMKEAEKFHRPVVCFVDTPGAFCGLTAEERGQGEAIARNLFEMSTLKTPIISFLIGEGGSGGALALAVADRVVMLENACYSILSPEGYASILWKDASKASQAAKEMKLTSYELKKLGVVDTIIPESEPAGENNVAEIAGDISLVLAAFLNESTEKNTDELVQARYERFRSF
ncbi:MAG: acetyl-CoA carboxylase carboxyltransferase subunit alpha [Lachnospiraceae bacterium]